MTSVKIRPKRTDLSQNRKIEPKGLTRMEKGMSIDRKVNKSNEDTDTSYGSKYANNAKKY